MKKNEGGYIMHNQNQTGNFQASNQIPNQQNHGGHELFDAHEAISGLVSGLEQSVIYEQHIQDPELQSIQQRQRTFLTQMYNTIVETLRTGQDPAIKTQTYTMPEGHTAEYGMQPTQPTTPIQSVNELNDQCISGFLMGALKSSATAFTTTALETTNPVLRRVFADSIPNLIEMAFELFYYQNKHHYYQVPQLKPEDMQQYTQAFAPIQGTMPH